MHAAAVKAQALIRGGLAEGPQLGRASEEMVMIWWVEEILHHLGWYFNPINNGINHLSTINWGRISSIN
jgi:hypothetical protein